MGQTRPLFVYLRPFLSEMTDKFDLKIVDGALGIRTQDRRMVGADKNH